MVISWDKNVSEFFSWGLKWHEVYISVFIGCQDNYYFWYHHNLAIDSGGYKHRFSFQISNYLYQKNKTEIENIYFRFNQDILCISGFTEMNIKHTTLDF